MNQTPSLPTESILRQKLQSAFRPEELRIQNESPMHGLPREAEKHFRVLLVSKSFEGHSRVDRQRQVYQLLAEELKTQVHALALQLLTPEEWEIRNGEALKSPTCTRLGTTKR